MMKAKKLLNCIVDKDSNSQKNQNEIMEKLSNLSKFVSDKNKSNVFKESHYEKTNENFHKSIKSNK